ncbi:flagellar hook-length control protein FliK [Clostridium pascui]|uniref:flagellar hook-length control protein FliK n=1 Tax=Clostridium pascui TaxID=46609 RepID=UPI00195D69B4|nr:flagellar hook-length control protein FliK [Clostridium pascui]MBM7869413.1 flagellar hook-length control protein FliK [Clostridium pascui]
MNVALGEIISNFNVKNIETPKKSEDTKFKDDFSKTLENKCKLSSKEIKKDNLQETKSKSEGKEVENNSNLDMNNIKDKLKEAGISEEKLNNINSIDDLEQLIKDDILSGQEINVLPSEAISIMEVLVLNSLNNITSKDEVNQLKEVIMSNVKLLIDNVNLDDSYLKNKLNSLLENIDKSILDNKLHIGLPESFKQNLQEELTSLVKEAKESLNKSSNKNGVIFEKYEVSLNKDVNVISTNTKQDKDSFLSLKDNKLSQEENILKNLSKDSSKDNKIENAVNFINHLKTTVENVQVPEEENIVINKSTFVNDILKTVKYMEINNLKDLTVKINPKELGEIIIKVTVEGGVMKANINAQNKEAFNLLNAHLSELNDKLQQNNIRIESLNINIYEDTTFFRGQSEHENSGKQQEKKNKSSTTEIQGLDIDEEISPNEELNNVNLFA